ncbi:phasin family protein [Rickettsiales bacterium]|nr:phasin family protein [Rickettsiales bacterium]
MSNNQNPFSSIWGSMNENNPFAEACSVDKFVAASRSGNKAFYDITRVITEGWQNLFSHQAEIFQKSSEELSRFVNDVVLSKDKMEEKAVKHADFIKSSVDSAVKNTGKMIEDAVQCNTQAYEIINKKASESFSDAARKPADRKKEAA